MRANKDFKCIVYLFFMSENAVEKMNFDVITHANFAFAIPTAEGHLLPLQGEDVARALVEKAHRCGAKVCLSVGGWSHEDIPLEATFRRGTDTAEKRLSLAEEMVAMMEKYNFDGIDVDWEYPRANDGSKQQYEQLIGLLADRLQPKGKLLTAAVYAGVNGKMQPLSDVVDAQDRPSFDRMDWLNLMTYDCDAPKHSTYEFAEACVDYWTKARGFEPEKLTLGLPFYGRPAPGSFRKLLEHDPDALEKDMVVIDSKEVWYNGRDTLTKKVKLAQERGLGGVMVWEIGEDTADYEKSLLAVLQRAMEN